VKDYLVCASCGAGSTHDHYSAVPGTVHHSNFVPSHLVVQITGIEENCCDMRSRGAYVLYYHSMNAASQSNITLNRFEQCMTSS